MAGELTSLSLAMGRGVVSGSVVPVLADLTVSPSSATVGTAYTGTVSGKTTGSTLTLSGAGAAGLSVSGSSITGAPTASGAVNVIETLAGATGSPKTNAGVISVAAAQTLALEAPVYSANSSKAIYAFGFDRMVDSYSGNTVRLKRLSDSVVQDFGFGTDGKFNSAGVDTWRGSADVDLVYFIDQMGGAKQLIAEGTVAFIRSNAVQRLGTTMGSDGQLTRSATNGAVAVDLGRDVGNLRLSAPTLNQVSGIEADLMVAFNERKVVSAAVAADAYGGNSNTENIFAWGTRSNNYIQHYFGGTAQSNLKYVTSAGSSVTVNSAGQIPGVGAAQAVSGKKFAQRIFTYAMDGIATKLYDFGRLFQTATYTATHQANMQAGAISNGDIVIGGIFNSTANTNLGATKANLVFSGLILWSGRTDKERYLARSKMNAIGQQHRIKLVSDIMAYFDEVVLMKNINQSTGLVTGEKGQLSLQFNVGTFPEGTANFNFAHTVPNSGLQGVYGPDDQNAANGFKATTSYFAGQTSGTVLSLAYRDGAGNSGTYGNDLSATLIQGTGNQNGSQNTDWSIGLGYDHNAVTFTGMMAFAKDPNNLTGTRKYADETAFGAAVYDGANQPMGKYNRNTAHGSFVFGETITGVVYTKDVWANVDTSGGQKLLDAPTGPATLDNLGNGWKGDCLALQIATFQAPAGYDRSASYAVRKAMRLQGVNKSYVSIGETPIAHQDGAVAINNNAAVVDSADNATIMSHQFQKTFKGDRIAFAFSTQVFSQSQIEEVQVNLYKLVA